MLDKAVHAVHVDHLAETLGTHLSQGLSQAEAQRRLTEHGPNELSERPRPGFLVMLWGQINNFLIIILIVASLVSLALGEVVDAAAIIAIVVLNSILGLVQESRAERALAALKKMAAPNAQVMRDGHQVAVPSRDLVPGDIVLLEAGNYVPADLRLVESINLRIEEASLTGESTPVEKNAQIVLDCDIPLGDRKNSAFMGTLVSYGRGRGLGDLHGHGHGDRRHRRDDPDATTRSPLPYSASWSSWGNGWARPLWPSAASSSSSVSSAIPGPWTPSPEGWPPTWPKTRRSWWSSSSPRSAWPSRRYPKACPPWSPSAWRWACSAWSPATRWFASWPRWKPWAAPP